MAKVVRILGVDPAAAKPMAWAMVVVGTCPDRPVCLFQGKGDVKELDEFIAFTSPDHLAVEDQYLNFSYKTAKQLSWSAGEAIGAAKIRGVETHVVNVASWKAQLLGKAKAPARGYVHEPEERFKQLFRCDAQGDDEACAGLIAYYQGLKIRETRR